ncbi:RagB/SusD family nutrient uptake outer membrane protein [Flavobacterium sp. MAHUQ-51]|uniref:RagB/SusD family nutrient uptake outer membrane protein n=1 Tax=Flavobacterium sp. GCM10022190 TaxID=3252639 RepID=UPI0036071E59
MKKYLIGIMAIITLFTSCDNYVDIKTEGKLIPEETVNFRYLLNNSSIYNKYYGLIDVASDDIIMRDDHATFYQKNYSSAFYRPYLQAYKWADSIYFAGETDSQMNVMYTTLYYSNVVIADVMNSKNGTYEEKLKLKGEAQVHRAFAFLNLVTIFGKAYDESTSSADLGIPIFTTPTVNEKVERASVKKVYETIISDLTEAANAGLNDINTGRNVVFPSKAAAYGLLARTYLYMGNYTEALKYAEQALTLKNSLLNLANYINTGDGAFPRSFQDPELILSKQTTTYSSSPLFLSISDELINSFDTKDLRYEKYTRSINTLTRGTLTQGRALCKEILTGESRNAGPTVPEMMLIKAECLARANNASGAMDVINTLRKSRFRAADYYDLTATDATDALVKVLAERRKELMGVGGFRWADLKRLNKESRFAKTITHPFLTQTFTITPGGNRYQFPFAPIYFELAPDLQQNN